VSKPPRRLAKKPAADLSVPLDRLSWRVEADDHRERLDRYLQTRLDWRSRTSIVALLTEGRVLRNGEVARRKALRIVEGDRIEVTIPPPDEDVEHEALGLRLNEAILHDDADLVALAKPAGLVVHPVGRIRVNTLIQGLHWLYHHGPRRDGSTPRICHRLDRDTSGVMVLAKNPAARTVLAERFERHDLEKDYLAVLEGRLEREEGTIEEPIGPDPDAPIALMMTTRPDGLPARTDFRVEERLDGATLVRFRIHTGRQHQIRVHAARALGHPVWGDALYGREAEVRQALHAARLALDHPGHGERLELLAPLPDDLRGLVERLRA
jgi:23S rRNA pseudouridine1911/1915/1917 synthase